MAQQVPTAFTSAVRASGNAGGRREALLGEALGDGSTEEAGGAERSGRDHEPEDVEAGVVQATPAPADRCLFNAEPLGYLATLRSLCVDRKERPPGAQSRDVQNLEEKAELRRPQQREDQRCAAQPNERAPLWPAAQRTQLPIARLIAEAA
jgi:hypothetical protein